MRLADLRVDRRRAVLVDPVGLVVQAVGPLDVARQALGQLDVGEGDQDPLQQRVAASAVLLQHRAGDVQPLPCVDKILPHPVRLAEHDVQRHQVQFRRPAHPHPLDPDLDQHRDHRLLVADPQQPLGTDLHQPDALGPAAHGVRLLADLRLKPRQ